MTPTPWTELLGHVYEDTHEEYGPHTQAVWSAFAALKETRWLSRVGEPVASTVIVVQSWDEAIKIFEDVEGAKYGPNGHLIEPVTRVKRIIASPRERVWWEQARQDTTRFTDYWGYIPAWMSTKTSAVAERTYEEVVGEYLYEFMSWLLAEIIAGDEARSTYFREQLEWFHAGHFPCGWEGNWPGGKMRVF